MKELAPEIGMSDATFESCQMSNGVLTIFLTSWDNCIIKIVFTEVIHFEYKIDSIVSCAYEMPDNDVFLKEAISMYYEKIPNRTLFKLFVIRDIDDVDFMKVVAEKAIVTKE